MYQWLLGETNHLASGKTEDRNKKEKKRVLSIFTNLVSRAWVSSSYSWALHCCSVAQSCPTLCNPMDCSVSGFPVLHCLPEFTQTYVHWVDDAMQTSHPVTPFSSCPQSFPLHSSWFCWWQESQRENTVYSLWKHRKPLSLAHVCLMFVSSRGTYLAFIRFC